MYLPKVFKSATHCSWHSESSTTINNVPVEIILDIAERLYFSADVLHLCLTSSRLHALLLPVLYSSVDLRTSKTCRSALDSLVKRPAETCCIRRLVVRPNHHDHCGDWPEDDEHLDETWVSQAIAEIAKAGNLQAMETFFWDGSKMPEECFWSILRTSCSQLRSVGSNVGSNSINPESQLFEFKDLTGFALTSKRIRREWDEFLPPETQLPDRLWEMLLTRCPHLRELTLYVSQISRRVWDVPHVLEGRWPELSKLALGDCYIESGENALDINTDSPFMHFLVTHPNLRSLYLPTLSSFRRTITLPSASLPHLDTFRGNLVHVEGLPTPALLKNLSLVYEPITEPMMPVLDNVLRKLTSLNSLSVWLQTSAKHSDHVHTGHRSLFQRLLGSCARLSHLELTCSSDVAFSISDFSAALHDSSMRLTTLVFTRLTGLPKYHFFETDIVKVAARLVCDNPSLRQFGLRDAVAPLQYLDGIEYRKMGTYTVLYDKYGTPERLLVQERGRGLNTQYVYKLRSRGIKGLLFWK